MTNQGESLVRISKVMVPCHHRSANDANSSQSLDVRLDILASSLDRLMLVFAMSEAFYDARAFQRSTAAAPCLAADSDGCGIPSYCQEPQRQRRRPKNLPNLPPCPTASAYSRTCGRRYAEPIILIPTGSAETNQRYSPSKRQRDIHCADGYAIIAELVIGFSLFQESATSEVTLDRPRQMLARVVNGPLEHLTGPRSTSSE
jgi:hypothetical protein